VVISTDSDMWVIYSFCRDVHEVCIILGYYTAQSGYCIPTFWATYRSHLQGSRNPRRRSSFNLKMEPVGCPKMLATNYHFKLQISQKIADLEEKNTLTQLSLLVCLQFKLLTWCEMSQHVHVDVPNVVTPLVLLTFVMSFLLHGLITEVFPFSLSFHNFPF
jgi:hypothetical protein